jgi:flagellar hook protein FlgE
MVNTSLYTGLSGLRSHQTYIDVIGANLANVSTPGYRGSRVTFHDLLSLTATPGAGPNGTFGGVNPRQIGLGSTVGSIDIVTNQGTFKDTGRPLDVALEGRGFFTLSDGVQTYYSRAGTFGLDASSNLVDLRSGYRVLNTSGSAITVPLDATLPAKSTSRIEFSGVLPAKVGGPLEEIVQSTSALQQGTAAQKQGQPASGTTYDLTGFVPSTVLVSANGKSQQKIVFDSTKFASVNAATASEIAAAFAPLAQDLQVTGDDSTGRVTYATVRLGETATLKFDEDPNNPGLLALLGLDTVLANGSQTAATAATDLAQMTMRQKPYANGDQIRVQGTNPNGTPFSATFRYGTNGTTVGDLIAFTNGIVAAGEVSLGIDGSGNLTLTAVNKGEASLSLHIGDVTSPAKNDWPGFVVTQEGTGPDTAEASIDVVDSLGRTHPITLEFTRTIADPNVWDLVATLDPSRGTVLSGSIASIRFGPDGSFSAIGGGTNSFTFSFPGVGSSQQVAVDLGTAGGFDGVSMMGDSTTVAAVDQDGYGPGTLQNIGFDQLGNLISHYSNGQSSILDTLRIAMFRNEGGLLRTGGTMFATAPNSDDAIATVAGSAGAGLVRAGALENSNIDIAAEFVSLIEAQRGFQANSRVITTTDQILAELVNIVR